MKHDTSIGRNNKQLVFEHDGIMLWIMPFESTMNQSYEKRNGGKEKEHLMKRIPMQRKGVLTKILARLMTLNKTKSRRTRRNSNLAKKPNLTHLMMDFIKDEEKEGLHQLSIVKPTMTTMTTREGKLLFFSSHGQLTRTTSPTKSGLSPQRNKMRKASSDSSNQEDAKVASTGPHEKKTRGRRSILDPEFLKTRTDPTVLAARQHVLRGEESKVLVRSYQQYGHSYLPSSDRKRKGNTTKLSREARQKSREMHMDRLNADPAYLAPVDFQSLHYCLDDDDDKSVTVEEKKLTTTKRRRKTFPVQATNPESPLLYGNCLVCTLCPCDACGENDSELSKKQSWCLIHPTGELLSNVCVSNLLLPLDASGSPLTRVREKWHKEKYRQELDVGETILQIIPCGDGTIAKALSGENQGIFVVRSANYCTVIRVETYRRKDEDPSSCSGKYNVEEVTRIDLRSLVTVISVFSTDGYCDSSSLRKQAFESKVCNLDSLSKRAMQYDPSRIDLWYTTD